MQLPFSIVVEEPAECKPLKFVTVSGDPNTPYLGYRIVINTVIDQFLSMEMPELELVPGQDDMLSWLQAHARAIRIAAEPTEAKWLDPMYREENPTKFNSNQFKRPI